MFEVLPREKPWVSWLYVAIWTLIIFVTIPLARIIQKYVAHHWSRELFTYGVLAAIVIALTVATCHVIRHRLTSRSGYFWLLAAAAIFVGYTIKLGKKSPEEAIHFIQYGVLSVFVYRALTHRLQDVVIYFAAAVICGIVGIIDEAIQWLIPNRHWDLQDIWINFFAGSLVQIAIAKGLKPKTIDNRFGRANLRFVCRLTAAAAILFWISLLNTPERIAWYAERIPRFAFLKHNDSVMLEYGYIHSHRDTGIFRSRFSVEELELNDRKRGKEAAEILDRYQDRQRYQEFLKLYNPVSDPFVHEARVHLYSRDFHFAAAAELTGNSQQYAKHLSIAFRENQIMEKYFSRTLHSSAYVWSADKLALAKEHLLLDWTRESRVSRELVTRVSEVQVCFFFALLWLGLVLAHGYLEKSK